jgi:hypothetical protein
LQHLIGDREHFVIRHRIFCSVFESDGDRRLIDELAESAVFVITECRTSVILKLIPVVGQIPTGAVDLGICGIFMLVAFLDQPEFRSVDAESAAFCFSLRFSPYLSRPRIASVSVPLTNPETNPLSTLEENRQSFGYTTKRCCLYSH